jgi:tetratricopeptide (TPR) repeat protein
MRWAAASLAVNTSAIRNLLPDVRAAWEKAPAGDTRLNLALLLAYGYRTAEDGAHLKEVAAEILKSFPDSYTAIGLAASADQLLKDWDDWKQMLESRLAKHPDDEELLRMKARCAEARGDWAGARATLQMLFDSGKATSADYNMYGWSALFDNSVNDDAIKASRQSNTLTHNNNFSEMHTLACLYAAAGKTSEARDLLLKAMPLFDLSLPNSPVWCALGLVYEQYGVDDAAIAAYEKVEKPEGQIDPEDTWLLAQARLKALKAKHP